jgi:hypothetical protein
MLRSSVSLKIILALTLVGWSAHAAAQTGSTPEQTTAASPHEASPSKASDLAELIKRHAQRHGIPSALAEAFIGTVSQYQTGASGRFGEVGLMQIHPAAAKQHGFAGGTLDLYEPEQNIRYGMAHLARAWSIANQDLCLTLLKYRTSYGEDDVTPAIAAECIEWRTNLRALGSPLANAAPAAAPHAKSIPAPRPAPQPSQTATPSVSSLTPTPTPPVRRAPAEIANTTAVREAQKVERDGAQALSRPKATARAKLVRDRTDALPARMTSPPRTPEESRRYWAAHEKRVAGIAAAFGLRTRRILQDQPKR